MTHALIIRMHYPENHPKFDWRFSYFKAMVLPRLLAQNNKSFKIAIRCNPVHKELFEKLSDRIITFGVLPEAEGYIAPENMHKAKRYFIDFVEWEKVVGLEKFDIQTAVDSDDLILNPNFIDLIEGMALEAGDQSMHVSFQPYMFHVPTLKTYKCPLAYSEDKGSPFFSIYQPNKEKYVFAFHDSHLKIGRFMDKRVFVGEGHCAFSIHDMNSSTYLYAKSKQIML